MDKTEIVMKWSEWLDEHEDEYKDIGGGKIVSKPGYDPVPEEAAYVYKILYDGVQHVEHVQEVRRSMGLSNIIDGCQ